MKDSTVYCSKGYFIDHMVNHHPELDFDDYNHIQEILDKPENTYLDTKTYSIAFEKEYKGRKEFVLVKKDENNKIILHKTFYYGKKVPKRFERIRPEEQGVTSVDGNPTISRLEKSKPDSPRLSVRDAHTFLSELNKKSRLNGGKFTDKGSSDKDNNKWYEKAATVNELLDFAERALNEKTQEKLFVGLVNDKTKERIKDITGLDVKSIIVESDVLRHSLNKEEHNLGIKDIRHMETVINNADNIRLSNKKHSDNNVIEFSKDINGEITFIEEFRVKRGQLVLVTCYRKKKEKPVVTAPMLHKSPEANVQNRNNAQAGNSINYINKKSRLKKALVEVFNFFTSDEREVL